MVIYRDVKKNLEIQFFFQNFHFNINLPSFRVNENDIPLLYEGMDDFSAEQMQLLDDEIQAIKVSDSVLNNYPHTFSG